MAAWHSCVLLMVFLLNCCKQGSLCQYKSLGPLCPIPALGEKSYEKIVMQQHFNAPVETVFNSLSQHATFNTVLWPVRSVRIKDAAPPEALDGVGSTRKMGFGPIKPILETITKVKPCELIEY